MPAWTQADELIVTLGTVPTLQLTLMDDLGYTEVESFRRIVREARKLGYDIERARFKGQTVLAHTRESLRMAHRNFPFDKVPQRMDLSKRRALNARLQHACAQ